MRRAIREHLRDFIAIVSLVALALAVVVVILVEQQADFPDWVPGLGEDRFELEAELTSAQAVTPGQGQSVNVAGIRVGAISAVEVEQGNAVVSMEIENDYAPLIREDASFLLRPRTGLADMSLELDPGSEDAQPIEEGTTVPEAQTAPNVNPDEILASLDADTRDFLRLLLADGGKALGNRGEELSAVLRRFEPTTRDIAEFSGALAERRENLRRVIHNFGLLVTELGRRDVELRRFVDSSNAVLGSFANQEAAIREALRELPPTLRETRAGLASSHRLARVLGPASRRLVPAARALAPALRQVRPLFRRTAGPIRDQIRPFTRRVADPIRHLNQASKGLAESTPALRGGFEHLNILFNQLAYNPPGAQDEGYLFWVSWLNHNLNNTLTLRDAHGPIVRSLVLANCGTAQLAESVARIRPFLLTLAEGTAIPRSADICPPGFIFREDAPDLADGGAATADAGSWDGAFEGPPPSGADGTSPVIPEHAPDADATPPETTDGAVIPDTTEEDAREMPAE
jgi:phospholipid/cholesterol/gamma-HCH transport system substrate-binding protein